MPKIALSATGIPEIATPPSIVHGDIVITDKGEILLADDEDGLIVLRGEGGKQAERGLRYESDFLRDEGCSYVINPVGLTLTLTIEK